MATAKRAGLDDDFSSLKTDLPPGRDAREALGAIVGQETASQETSTPDDRAAIAWKLVRAAPADPLVPFPLQLPLSQVTALRKLKVERGLVPAHIVREAIVRELKRLG